MSVRRKEVTCHIFGYSTVKRHSKINHCDRRITLFSDTDISFGLFNLFTYFDMPCGR